MWVQFLLEVPSFKPHMKKVCVLCNNEFNTRGGNYDKHVRSCTGTYKPFIKLGKCAHCDIEFIDGMRSSEKMNHSRWCEKNPKLVEYKSKNNGKHLNTQAAVERRAASIRKAHTEGRYSHIDWAVVNKGRKHSEETKTVIREKALASTHRRLRRKMIEYKGVMLDSTWELALAKRLDDICVAWVRPGPIPWIDDNNVPHNYFPDFYLPEYDLFLDPKNPQAVRVQKEKLALLLKQHHNVRILYSLDECKEFNP